MTHRIRCSTKFDITATGVKNHSRSSRLPFKDEAGQTIDDLTAWNRARNQQRNWETLNQLISLRVLPEDISDPVRDGDCWAFEFSINSLETVSSLDKPLSLLIHDCQDVPMILGLDENNQVVTLTATGDNPNITFELVYNK
jgi:hypothetical protein